MCIILTTFVYSQCKLALQVQSKHIKNFKKKKNKQTKLKPTGILEGGKKEKRKRKSAPRKLNKPKNTIHEPLALFI